MRILGPKRDEIIRDRGSYIKMGFINLYFSPNIIRMAKSRRIR
jgi:hypothetical protein